MPPKVIAFDIIETVFPIEPLRGAFTARGLPAEALELWFAQSLRDAFALAATDRYLPFRALLVDTLRSLMVGYGITDPATEAEAALAGMKSLPARPETEASFDLIASAGVGIMALSNGAAAATRGLLEQAVLHRKVDQVVSVDEVGHFKPRREVYRHAAAAAGVEPRELALVAVHPWDLHGAKCAGLATGFLTAGGDFPEEMEAPDVRGATLVDVAARLLALP